MTDSANLRTMGYQLIAMAESIEERSPAFRFGHQRTDASPMEMAAHASLIYSMRRERERFLPKEILGEPAWDMLLELFVASVKGGELSIKSISHASGVPPTTALRYIEVMVANGSVLRRRSTEDKRVSYIRLSKDGYNAMSALIKSSMQQSTTTIAGPIDGYLRPVQPHEKAGFS